MTTPEPHFHVDVLYAGVLWPLPDSDLGWVFAVADPDGERTSPVGLLSPDAEVTHDQVSEFAGWVGRHYGGMCAPVVRAATQQDWDAAERFDAWVGAGMPA